MHQRLTPKITVDRLLELYTYDKEKGIITQKQLGKKVQRRIFPHPESGDVVVYDPANRVRQRFLFRHLAYVLGSQKDIPDDKRVLCHDLNDENIVFRNLKLVDKSVYRDIQIALRNLEGDMKIIQHPVDKHAYKLVWREYKMFRSAVHYDIANAEQDLNRRALELVKFVNHHIVSN